MDCEGCIFAQMGAKPRSPVAHSQILVQEQVSCACDRLDILEPRGEAYINMEKPYYQLTKFCNMYRNDEWREKQIEKWEEQGEQHSFQEDYIDAARNEVMPLFGIAVWDHTGATFDDLNKTVMSLPSQIYPVKKMKAMVSTFQSRGVGAVADLINRVQAEEFKNAVATFHLHEQRALRDTEIFKKLVQGTFFVHIEAGYVLPPDLFSVIDESMNDRLERIAMWEGTGWSVIHRKVATSLYLEFMDYDKLVDHVRDIAKEQNVYRHV